MDLIYSYIYQQKIYESGYFMERMFIGQNRDLSSSMLDLRMCNRHGLIAGATGTGKTITLQVLAEQFSEAGVPVFATDIKGDLSGIGEPGTHDKAFTDRAESIGLCPYTPKQYPTRIWDIMGVYGTPLKATVSDMGSQLMAKLLDLTPAQAGALNVAYTVGEQYGAPIISLADLKYLLKDCMENHRSISTEHGYVSASTLGIALRGVTFLESQGGTNFSVYLNLMSTILWPWRMNWGLSIFWPRIH